jgi:hypothetical protein
MKYGAKDEAHLGDGAYVARDEYGGIIFAANDKVTGEPSDVVFLDQHGVEQLRQYLERYMV